MTRRGGLLNNILDVLLVFLKELECIIMHQTSNQVFLLV